MEFSKTILGLSFREWAFWFMFIGFAIKLPIVPLHTWLPDAHVEAPTPVSVVLAGLLLKIGGYGLFRFVWAIFPAETVANLGPLAIIGVLAIVYGGLTAMAQNDLKRLVAYSSVSHMGFVVIGLAALTTQGASGGLFHMVSHGLLSPALFLLVGVIYDRTSNRQIEDYSGLGSQLPVFTAFTGIFFFASLGLPGFSGFVGELLVLLGAFGSTVMPTWVAIVSVTGILISAAYFLWALQRMYFGEFWVRKEEWMPKMKDLDLREWILFLPLALVVLILGIFPSLLLDPVQPTLDLWVDHLMQFVP